MELSTSWHRKGREEGRQEGLQEGLYAGLRRGRQELLLKMLRKRLGALSSEVEAMIAGLSEERFDEVTERLFDMTSEADLRRFLTASH
jgi:flagellar biosynthesis/type III secretory pathway protein FliH